MNDDVLGLVGRAELAFVACKKLHQDFLRHFIASRGDESVSSLKVTEGDLSILCFEMIVRAKPRAVKVEDGQFWMEYVFVVGDPAIEVWRMYLNAYGQLVTSVDDSEVVGDFNVREVVPRIITAVKSGVLASSVLKPAEPLRAD